MPKSFWENFSGPIAIAHRGGDGAGIAKENTLKAFAAAAKLGYQYGETDVVLTADGQVIAVHGSRNRVDSLLNKRRPARPMLQRLTHEQVRTRVTVDGERVPLLREVLEAQPKMKFFIDAKTDEVVEPLAKLLIELKIWHRVSVGSFNYDRVQRLIKLTSGKAYAQLNIDRNLGPGNKNLRLLKSGQLKGVSATHLHHSLASRQMIDVHHSQNLKALIWTCNTPLLIRKAIDCGADGIISDRAALLKDTLAQIQPAVTKSTK